MQSLSLLAVILSGTLPGVAIGFVAGLVPGLHMNNLAAAVSAYVGTGVAVGGLMVVSPSADSSVVLACFVSGAMIAHLFATSVTSTYVGIPAEDVVSVLPAHRLAKAGLGRLAVVSAADGSLAGVIASVATLVPLCIVMGQPVGFYSLLRVFMLPVVLIFVSILLLSEGRSGNRLEGRRSGAIRIAKPLLIFVSSGCLGLVALSTGYCTSPLPDFPWMDGRIVARSSLLLPMFAGLFGVPGLLFSLGSRRVTELRPRRAISLHHLPSKKDILVVLFGGAIVGWMPGMTSGSAVTLSSPRTDEVEAGGDISSATRFIWLYSAITSSGAVFAVGALFTILRARSGSMDAIESIIGSREIEEGFPANIPAMGAIVLSILVSALVCHFILTRMSARLVSIRWLLTSKTLALCSLALVCGLTAYLTGSRGVILMAAAVSLGLIPPLVGVRRIQLMGCLLLPMIASLALA